MAQALATLIPSLVAEEDHDYSVEIGYLKELNIVTDVDLLFLDIKNSRHPSIPASTILDLQNLVGKHSVAAPAYGSHLISDTLYRYRKEDIKSARLPTSFSELDLLLDGGWELGEVIEVSGSRDSEKTRIVLYSVLSHLILNQKARTLYVLDQYKTFEPHQAYEIALILIHNLKVQGFSVPNVSDDVHEDDTSSKSANTYAIDVLDRLEVAKCATGDVVAAQELINAGVAVTKLDLTLTTIVVDAITPILGDHDISKSSLRNHAEVVTFMRTLIALSKSSTLPLTIFVINEAIPTSSLINSRFPPPISRFPTMRTLKPALGLTMTYMTDITLWITRGEHIWGSDTGSNRATIEVAKNRRGESAGWMAVVVDGNKIQALR